MKYIFSLLIIVVASCNKMSAPTSPSLFNSFSGIISSADSVCGIPIFNCLHKATLIDSSTVVNKDTAIFTAYLKYVNTPDTLLGVWCLTADETLTIKSVKGQVWEIEYSQKDSN